MNTEKKIPDLVPLTKWSEFFIDPSVGALRWMVFSNEEFKRRCVLRRGRRILIDTAAYNQWLRETSLAEQ
jgi:hypothetical protein